MKRTCSHHPIDARALLAKENPGRVKEILRSAQSVVAAHLALPCERRTSVDGTSPMRGELSKSAGRFSARVIQSAQWAQRTQLRQH
jgi:hypothetical protein